METHTGQHRTFPEGELLDPRRAEIGAIAGGSTARAEGFTDTAELLSPS